jgi:UDP-N-acetylmuramoyl-tripeptide--D-alanyl-D-alanine ligase
VIPLSAGEVEGALLASGDGDRRILRVTVDSRAVAPGDLFVALRGEHADGHAFAQEAARRGAAAVLAEPERLRDLGETALLEARDPLAALGLLARQVRRRSAAKVIGIAGSVGKTSTKDTLAALLAPVLATVASHANYNNELGVPLTLCRIEPDTRACVCEMAMRGLGEVAYLASLAEPDVAVVTAIGPEHMELLGSLERVAEAELEAVAGLPAGATAVLPHGEPLIASWRRADLREITFGDAPEADVRVLRFVPEPGGARAAFDVLGEHVELRTNLRAPHHRLNLAAALAACAAIGVDPGEAAQGAARVDLSRWRGEELSLPGGGVLVNDAYNANPLSMRAALVALVERAGGARSVAVLGDMAELGDEAPAWHSAAGREAAELGVDLVVAVGPLARHLHAAAASAGARSVHLGDREAAIRELPALIEPGDVVLVKASRAAGLERLAAALAGSGAT